MDSKKQSNTNFGSDVDSSNSRVLWLRPSKPSNISVGRERIADHLEREEFAVDFADASGKDAFTAFKKAVKGNYDIIIGTVRMGLYIGFPLSKVLQIPFIADVTDPIEQIDHLPEILYKNLYKYEHLILSNANECMFTYASSFEIAQQRDISGIKVYNGVDYNQFNNPDESIIHETKAILRDHNVDLDNQIAMYIGGLSPVYHIQEILEAASQTKNWEFVLLGAGQLGEEVRKADSSLQNLHYLGSFDYELMPGFLAQADVGFCLVDAEQPLKVLEYGAAGVATLSIPGELKERFSDDDMLFIQPDSKAIARTLYHLSRNPSKLKDYGKNLNEKAKQFDWATVASEYRDAIRELTDEN